MQSIKRVFFQVLLAACLALALVGCKTSSSGGGNETSFSLSIIHVNDSHSHLASETYSLYFNGVKTKVPFGGFPRLTSKIKSLQQAYPDSLILHAGDMVQGTIYYTIFKGEATAAMMNQIPWTAVTLGNHEFDDGNQGLKSFLDQLNAPVVCANVDASNSILAGYWQPYKVVEINGEKVGIIGLETAKKTKESSSPGEDIIFQDEKETIQQYVQELEDQGINKIIVLSHYGMENDLNLAKEVEGIDVIVDGDSHSLLGNYTSYGVSSQYDNYPQIVNSPDGHKVCVVSAWQYAYAVGHLNVDFNDQGEVVNCNGVTTLLLGNSFRQKNNEGEYVEVNDTVKNQILELINNSEDKLEIVPEDPTALAALQTYKDQIEEQSNTVIGRAAEDLPHLRIPDAEHPKGSEIAPLVAKSFYEKVPYADLCIQNAGGVRISIDAGDITIGEVYTLLPFANTLYTLQLTGAEVKQVLEDALANFLDNGGSTGSFPYAYGIRYDIDLSQPQNQRISNLEIMDKQTKQFHPIDPNTLYTVVTNSYIAAGKDGYTTFKTVQDNGRPGVDTYYDYAMSFVDMVKNLTAQGKELEKLPREEHCIHSFRGE